MDQTVARKTLQDLIKREDLDNKRCIDCLNPNPQWASLSFAVFLCLQCAGLHRGYGVHVSFVRSVSMDTWQEDQIKRMQLGGNAPFKDFMRSYPADLHGGYKEGMSPYDTYHSWAAAQYREKLDSELNGKTWAPSAAPEGFGAGTRAADPTARPSSAQGLRKSRASARNGTALRGDSGSPAPGTFQGSPDSTPSLSISADQKAANEAFFSRLGQANAARPDDLPPSQGGRYQGFGSTPAPSSSAPPFGTTSRAAPSLTDFQENPAAALSRGWSLFSSAVAGATRAVSESVIQPGLEKVADPAFHASVQGYVAGASRRAGAAGRSANAWGREALGVDVAEQVGGVIGTVRERVGGGPQSRGYGTVGQGGAWEYEQETAGMYRDEEDEQGAEEFGGSAAAGERESRQEHGLSAEPSAGKTSAAASSKKADDWDEWKDF